MFKSLIDFTVNDVGLRIWRQTSRRWQH